MVEYFNYKKMIVYTTKVTIFEYFNKKYDLNTKII